MFPFLILFKFPLKSRLITGSGAGQPADAPGWPTVADPELLAAILAQVLALQGGPAPAAYFTVAY